MNQNRTNQIDFCGPRGAYFYQTRSRTESLVETGSSDPETSGVEIIRRTWLFGRWSLQIKISLEFSVYSLFPRLTAGQEDGSVKSA